MGPATKVNHSASDKKAYTKPCLHVYGSVEKITRNLGSNARAGDNRNKMNHKTGG